MCEQAYTEIMSAYQRLCQRLGADGEEDKDIEVIINSYELITEYLCMKMFDYGVLCAKGLVVERDCFLAVFWLEGSSFYFVDML